MRHVEPPACLVGCFTISDARPFVISLWLKRWLEETGYRVLLAENITDINDKIYSAAPGRSAELAAAASQWYVDDTNRLGLGRPDYEPKASETVPEILDLIGTLIERGLAYPSGGDVYFRVAAFPEYGRLSGRDDEDALHNPSEEPERDELKEDPRDFALWKAHKEGEDTVWESPWGPGRPGWHIDDGEEVPRACVRDPRRRQRPDLSAPRERDRSVARGRRWVRPDVDAQRDA